MNKSLVYCTGDPETCENCKSIKEFTERLKKTKAEAISIPLLTYLRDENKLRNDE